MEFVTKIKLGAVTNLSDARYAAALGAEWIGFNFDNTAPEYISPVTAKEIIDWVEGVEIVGEFGDVSAADISEYINLLNLTYIEVDNDLGPNELATLPVGKIKVINKIDNDADDIIKIYSDVVDYYLLRGYAADEVKTLAEKYPVIWDVPVLNDELVADIIRTTPTAINLKGEDEEQPGTRDFSLLNEYMDQLRTEEI